MAVGDTDLDSWPKSWVYILYRPVKLVLALANIGTN